MIARLPQETRRPDAATMALLRETRAAIAARPVDLAAAVYRHLPSFAPRTKELMAAEIRAHGDSIVRELLRAVEVLDALSTLEDDLRRLGAAHAARYGVPAEHFPYVGQALVRAVRELFPNSEGGPLGSAWLEVFEWLAAEMTKGAAGEGAVAARAVEQSPAYWRSYVEDAPVPAGDQSAEGSVEEPTGPKRVNPAADPTISFDRGELFERLARADDLRRAVKAAEPPTAASVPTSAAPAAGAAHPPVAGPSPARRDGTPEVRPVSPAGRVGVPGAQGGVPSEAGSMSPPPGRMPPAAGAQQVRPRRSRNPWSWGARSRKVEQESARPPEPPPAPEPRPAPPRIDPAMYDSPPEVAPPPGAAAGGQGPQNLDFRHGPVVPAPRRPVADDAPTEVLRLDPRELAAPTDAPTEPTAVGESVVSPPEPTGENPAAPLPADDGVPSDGPRSDGPRSDGPAGQGLRGVGTGWPRTSPNRPVRPATNAEPDLLNLGDAPAQE